jgi:glycine/D-amino acid oxidase-like deaminating enzyme
MKRTLDLRTGTPVWQAYRTPSIPAKALTRDVKADVLVVGMGISGAMMAETLASDGMSVIAIDRRGPIKGSTAATTALVQFEIDQPLSLLAGKIGKDRGERAWRRSRLALFNLKARIAELAIPCGHVERNSLYLSGNVLDPGALREEGERRRATGLQSVYLSRSALKERFGLNRAAALLSAGNLSLDPKKLAAGLFRRAAANSARFYAPVEATSFERASGKIAVATRDGPTITAATVILATGYELTDIVPARGHQIISTWAIATRRQPKALWPEEAFIWEASDPYLYMRSTDDGRVVCGGEDEEFTDEERRDALITSKSQHIARKLGRLFPKLDTKPEFAWAGSFGTTSSGLPIIGHLPRHPGVFAIMGYGGNGITFSQIASEIVRSALAGRPDRDADLFAFAK